MRASRKTKNINITKKEKIKIDLPSASSRSRMAFQRATRSRISARRSSSFSESRPRSPAHTCWESVDGAFSVGLMGDDGLDRAVVSDIRKPLRLSVSSRPNGPY